MNKFHLIIIFITASIITNAQTFTTQDLQKDVLKINTSNASANYDALYKRFSAVTSEKIPARYYAAVSQYLKTEVLKEKTPNQSLLESNALAYKDAVSILNSQPDNIEITTLISLVILQKITLNASNNIQKDKDQIMQYIVKAESVSKNNPRLTLLNALMKKQFPEENFGNMSTVQLYQKAATDFAAINTADTSAPNWGKQLLPLIQ
nr:hypothetical protein [uncultured Chryseobacterium sp.]